MPGNPYRVDQGRKLEAFYWIVANWPSWVRKRSFLWPIFCIVRSKVVKRIPGGLGEIMVRILKYFFGLFERDISLPHPDGEFMMTAEFAGFIADLMSHVECTAWLGVNAVRCCLNCGNVVNRPAHRLEVGEVNLSCWECGKFVMWSNEDIFAMIDELNRLAPRMSDTALEQLQTDLGFQAGATGLMADHSVRHIYKPAEHHHRDWVHLLVQDGIANTEVPLVVASLQEAGIEPEHLRNFCDVVKLPTYLGKADKQWFGDRAFRSDRNMKGFASAMLTVIQVLYFFMLAVVDGARIIPQQFRCFELLYFIVGILRDCSPDIRRHTGATLPNNETSTVFIPEPFSRNRGRCFELPFVDQRTLFGR